MTYLLFLMAFFVKLVAGESKPIKYEIHYTLTYALDSTNISSKNQERMILDVGESSSVFHSYLVSRRDSINSVRGEIFDSGNLDLAKLNSLRSKFNYRVFYNFSDFTIYQEEKVSVNNYGFVSPFKVNDWKITEMQDSVAGYVCQKATVEYGGRMFEAWFTNAIPIYDGPYVFKGLPGLVLKVNDLENHYVFEYVGMEQTPPNREFPERTKNTEITNFDKVSFIKKSYREDPASVNANIAAYTAGMSNYRENNRRRASRENNPLETNQ